MSNLLNIKDQNGNWIPIPVVTNGIQSITQNQDYTLTITLNDGTTYTTTSIKGEDGQDYVLTENDKQEIASLVDVPVEDVQVNNTSIVTDGVANIPIASSTETGVIKIGSGDLGIAMSGDTPFLIGASSNHIKSASPARRPIFANMQHESTFYGLAKAAGHDEKNSTLPVGQYTDSAKTAIKQMLGVKDDYDSLVVEVSGTDPVITGKASYRYNCGELYTLSITPPETGTMDIIFTSGATPTVLSLPNTVKMPDWWVGIETNTTYEMCITDGTYCGVMSWAT